MFRGEKLTATEAKDPTPSTVRVITTRYQDAVSTAALLGRGRLLTVAGWGHTSLFLSSCADAYVSRYLLTGRVPPKGTVCDVDVVPFSQPRPACGQRVRSRRLRGTRPSRLTAAAEQGGPAV